MEERAIVTTSKQVSEMDQNVLRAVYALNMCTVSVSQIIDYNDTYILEQEYDAILNNLNLEKMPKADALKKILVELLNTITFFRIQEIKKEEIEKKYQKKVKNAIWSAVPNLNMIVAGDPAAIAFSIASQVGIGYMNYRKEKNNAVTEKEKEELELKITAIEQFHALRRELFTTAWELAEEYEFDDRLRLTEKQIKQYNQILMDRNELRKYVRLEAIKDKFEAFPPFWYNFGHTASFIAGDPMLPLEEWEREYYRTKAKEHFSHYEKLNKFNILREDQMTCAFALEYADLLLLEEKLENKEKIAELISIADNMSGTALDIKQLCAISYLKVGETGKAAELLKQLVNEEYNTITNAKILSRIYVSQFLSDKSPTAKFDYKTLVMRLGEENTCYLFPMPDKNIDDNILQKEYLIEAKTILTTDYITVIHEVLREYTVKFNKVIPAPYKDKITDDYFGYTDDAKERRRDDIKKILQDIHNKKYYLETIASVGFRFKYIDLLNEIMEIYDDLSLWKNDIKHNTYTRIVNANIISNNKKMKEIQNSMTAKTFTVNDYKILQDDLTIRKLLGKMIDNMIDTIMQSIDSMSSLEEIENAEYELSEFCLKHGISLKELNGNVQESFKEIHKYLDYSLIGIDGENENRKKEIEEKKRAIVKDKVEDVAIGSISEIDILFPNDTKFNLYFNNKNFKADSLRNDALVIIDDKTKKDFDLILEMDRVIIIKHNRIKGYHDYKSIEYGKSDRRGEYLVMGLDEYNNKNVDISKLYGLIESLRKVENDFK